MSARHGAVALCALSPEGERGRRPPVISAPALPLLACALALRARIPRSTASLSAVRIASWSRPSVSSLLMVRSWRSGSMYRPGRGATIALPVWRDRVAAVSPR
eukprot:3865517-Pyramimonas_sp.AAC.1